MADEGLVKLAVESQVAENAARACRLLAFGEYHQRQVRQGGEPCPADPSFFVLTPMQSTTAEFSGVLAVSDMTIEIQVGIVDRLRTCFPNVWDQCLAGRLDLGRAQILLDAASSLANEEDIARFAKLMDDYIDKFDDKSSPICTVTRDQLQRAARYRKMKFEQKSEEESFAAAFKRRRLSFRPGEDGMGSLTMQSMISDAMTADYRVTLIAKKLRENPEETRTLEQIRADVAVDLLLGKLEVTATLAQLEVEGDDTDGEGDDLDSEGSGSGRRDPADYLKYHSTGAYARPVVNVTVPIQTLMGLSDGPGVLSGGNPIPAELARIIAQDPGSTWYRMLTDPARTCIELSTDAYKPTRPIWRQVISRDHTCIWPGCRRPAVRVELDHREEHPEGETSTENLEPLCKHHHKVKHSRGFKIIKNADGSYTWTTPTGSTFTHRPDEQPVADWPDPETVAYEELINALDLDHDTQGPDEHGRGA